MSLLGNLTVGILGNMSGLSGSLKESQSEIQKFSKNVDKLGKSVTNVGKSMSLFVTGPIVALGTAAFAVGNDFDKAMQTIRVGTGAVGEDLLLLEQDFKSVFGAIPTSTETASAAIANLNTLTSASGEALQEMTKSVLEVSRLLGEDGVANSEAFGKAMQQWQLPAEQAPELMDKLFKITQDTGIGFGQLTNQLNTYGPVLQNAGFTAEETAELMGRMNAAGLDWSRISPGLNASFRRWAAEGKDLKKEFGDTVEAIKNAETATEALTIATETFGAEGAQRLTTGIRQGAIALDDLGLSLENVDGLIAKTAEENKTFSDSMLELKNQLMLTLEPLGTLLLEAFQNLMPYIERAIEFIQGLANWFTNLNPGIQQIILVIAGLVAALGPVLMILGPIISTIGSLIPVLAAVVSPVGLVIAAVAALTAGFIYLWNTNENFKNAVIKIWEFIKNIAVAVFSYIKEFVMMIFDGIKDFWDKWGDTIIQAFKDYFEILKIVWGAVFKFVFNLIKTVFNGIKKFWDIWGDTIIGAFKTVFNILKTVFEGVWNGIKIVVETAIGVISNTIKLFLSILKGDWKGAWEAVKGIAESIWNGIKKMFSNVYNTMLDIGKDIIRGLANGIKNVAGAVKDTVKDVASSIGDGIKGFFGISSPSKLMAEYGQNIGEGLVRGIESQTRAVAAATDQMIGAASVEIPSANLPRINTTTTDSDGFEVSAVGVGGVSISFAGAVFQVRSDEDIPLIAQELGVVISQNMRALGGSNNA